MVLADYNFNRSVTSLPRNNVIALLYNLDLFYAISDNNCDLTDVIDWFLWLCNHCSVAFDFNFSIYFTITFRIKRFIQDVQVFIQSWNILHHRCPIMKSGISWIDFCLLRIGLWMWTLYIVFTIALNIVYFPF